MLSLYCPHFFKDCTEVNWEERAIYIILTTDEIESVSIESIWSIKDQSLLLPVSSCFYD